MAQQTFVDEARIHVCSGRGGDGYVGFRREKFEPRGGPDGGDGGRGGDVIFEATRNESTLLVFRSRREFRADDGRPGAGSQRTGADGEGILIRVPLGTMVFAADADEDSEPLADLSLDGERFVIARGGRGGKGNTRFKTSTRRSPDFAQEGRDGQGFDLRLSLKLLADVGLVGFPNAGKSTLIRAVSAARPKVGSYPFTTLVPTLGLVEHGERRFVMADIPGLIEGASEGVGLGDRFLRHVERTRVIVHLLDLGAMMFEDRDPQSDYEKLRKELGHYRAELLERREIVLLNKMDLVGDDEGRARVDALEASLEAAGCTVLRTSGATGKGARELVAVLARILDEQTREEAEREADAAANNA